MNITRITIIVFLFALLNVGYTSIDKINSGDKTAPEFSLQSTDGETITLGSLKGKFIVIHIATTWCPYCNAEAPYLEKIYNEYKEKGVEVIIIDVKESNALVTEKIKDKFNLSFPVLLDTDVPFLDKVTNLKGNIQFVSLLDTRNFDVKLVELKQRLNELL